ncbi:uncharacterized protein CXQ87_000090 [Candidozyma duobushaemuli]|uniref:Hsp90 chaperone protein kinase-targeting subunit n=1 Tax=Candidozyma duobushaemuli TaxID=1231522 RepID=A0A2V1AH12_9ASCO|nr:uncharacterized protein CXQ87_000090 [[Candida] duobushaemulonis]PVH17208.1 hypothetical protein CXQ87_000090 [[Candida] duobushaemulonis]
MPIDYSKWDKIELSDDSDVEVHPNVDKRSFIKWKQRDIHEKRQQRNIEIKSILVQLTMYAKLNARLDFLMEKLQPLELLDEDKVKSTIDAEYDPTERFNYEKIKSEKDDLRKGLHDLEFSKEEVESMPPYNEMVEDLFTQVKEDHPEVTEDGQKLTQHLKEHRAKIDDILSKQTIKLDSLLQEKANLISSDDYHTGFDSSFINKNKEEAEAKAKAASSTASTTTETSIETLNSPTSQSAQAQTSSSQDEYDQLVVLPETAAFAQIPYHQQDKGRDFLLQNPKICNENQKDALIMTAFDHQLEGKENLTKQVVYQSLILQYIGQLAGGGQDLARVRQSVQLFFSNLMNKSTPVAAAFNDDVDRTVKHIQTRCKIIQEERQGQGQDQEEGSEVIQLRSLDDKGSQEHEIFTTKLSKEMQEAIKTGELDEVNKVFAAMKVEDAENALEIINECNVIGLSGYLENEQEFEDLKARQENNTDQQEIPTSTVDSVD